MRVHWGPLTKDDAAHWAQLQADIEAVDHLGFSFTVEDVAEWLDNPLLDLERGTLAARIDKKIIAVAVVPVRPTAEPDHLIDLWGGGVHPEFRRQGYGKRIIDWTIEVAPTLHEQQHPGKPLELLLSVADGNTGLIALAGAAGFEPARWFLRMRRDLRSELPRVRVPDGIEIVTWTQELDGDARFVRNESFLDHWGNTPHTEESWTHRISGTRAFRGESTFLALSQGRAVGVLVTHQRGDEAWIQIVGTLREWRGRGVASALLTHALATFQAQGYATAGLGVDADNGTGAVGVYERVGFEVRSRGANYALKLMPA